MIEAECVSATEVGIATLYKVVETDADSTSMTETVMEPDAITLT